MDHYYTYPNTQLFPDFAGNGTGWFDFLQGHGLRASKAAARCAPPH